MVVQKINSLDELEKSMGRKISLTKVHNPKGIQNTKTEHYIYLGVTKKGVSEKYLFTRCSDKNPLGRVVPNIEKLFLKKGEIGFTGDLITYDPLFAQVEMITPSNPQYPNLIGNLIRMERLSWR